MYVHCTYIQYASILESMRLHLFPQLWKLLGLYVHRLSITTQMCAHKWKTKKVRELGHSAWHFRRKVASPPSPLKQNQRGKGLEHFIFFTKKSIQLFFCKANFVHLWMDYALTKYLFQREKLAECSFTKLHFKVTLPNSGMQDLLKNVGEVARIQCTGR